MSNKSKIPLSVWGYSLLIVGMFFLVTLQIPKEKAQINIDNKRLQKLKSIKTSSRKNIIAIGTSLTGHALYPDDKMNLLAKDIGVESINFLRYANSGRDLNYFDNLFTKMLEYKPDIVFLDASLIFYDSSNINKFKFRIKNYIKKSLLGINSPKRRYEEIFEEGVDRKKVETLKGWEKGVLSSTKRETNNLSLPLLKFIKYAKKNSIKVYIFNFSRAKEAEAIYPKELSQFEDKMALFYLQEYNIGYIKYPSRLSKNYFTDYAHANRAGREVISKYFLMKVDNILNGREI